MDLADCYGLMAIGCQAATSATCCKCLRQDATLKWRLQTASKTPCQQGITTGCGLNMLQWCWTVLNDVERGFLRISEASRTTSTLSLHFGPYRQIHGAQGSHLRAKSSSSEVSRLPRTNKDHAWVQIHKISDEVHLSGTAGWCALGQYSQQGRRLPKSYDRGHWLPLWRKITKASDSCRLLWPHPLHVANALSSLTCGRMRRWSEGFKPLQKLNVNKG